MRKFRTQTGSLTLGGESRSLRARHRGTGMWGWLPAQEPCFSNWTEQLGCEYPPFVVLPDGSFHGRVQPAWGEEALESWGACLFPFRLVSGIWGVGVRPGGTHAPLQPVLEGAFSKGGQGWPELETKVAGREDKRPSGRQVSAAVVMDPSLHLQAAPPASCLPQMAIRQASRWLIWPETHDSQSSPTGENAQKET